MQAETDAGFSGWKELSGLDLNPHEQHHAHAGIHLRSINCMTSRDICTYPLWIINEVRSERYHNYKTPRNVLDGAIGHHQDTGVDNWGYLGTRGRCFGDLPVDVRVFDKSGRVIIVQRPSVLRGRTTHALRSLCGSSSNFSLYFKPKIVRFQNFPRYIPVLLSLVDCTMHYF